MQQLRRKSGWRRGAPALVLALAAACATTSLPPFSSPGGEVRLEDDEKRLWKKVETEQVKLDSSERIHHDPLLEAYLNEVARSVVPPAVREGRTPLRVYVKIIKEPTLNAFAYPNGKVYVHSGLLSRVENEAQLATILGHEIAHATHRHAIRSVRHQKNTQIAFITASIISQIGLAVLGGKISREGSPDLGVAVASAGSVLSRLGLFFAFNAARNGYGRELEREADSTGFDHLVRAGYDPREGPKVFRLLVKEYGDPKSDLEQFFFASHPRNRERIANLSEFLRTRYPHLQKPPREARLKVNTQSFQMRTRPLVRENARLDIEAGRFKLAAAQLDRVLRLVPNDAKAHYYYGELHRRSAKGRRGRMRALVFYEKAAAHDPAFAEPHRGMGLVAYRLGWKRRAVRAFQRYLRLAKRLAKDREQINDYIVELGGTPVHPNPGERG